MLRPASGKRFASLFVTTQRGALCMQLCSALARCFICVMSAFLVMLPSCALLLSFCFACAVCLFSSCLAMFCFCLRFAFCCCLLCIFRFCWFLFGLYRFITTTKCVLCNFGWHQQFACGLCLFGISISSACLLVVMELFSVEAGLRHGLAGHCAHLSGAIHHLSWSVLFVRVCLVLVAVGA